MGLTVHWKFSTRKRKKESVLSLLEKLRQRAMDMPFKGVGEIVILEGENVKFTAGDRDDPFLWEKITGQKYIEYPKQIWEKWARHDSISPEAILCFTIDVGDGSESATIGFCKYPKYIEYVPNTILPHRKAKMEIKGGWQMSSFCKTQYANEHGLENFLRCHKTLIDFLDYVDELGALESVSDEGDYYENRDLEKLAQEIGEWDSMVAALCGKIQDSLPENASLIAPIKNYSNFEYLEAKGNEKENES